MSSIHTTLHNSTTRAAGSGGVGAAVAKLRGALAQVAAHLAYVRAAPKPHKNVDMKVSFVLGPGLIVELVPDAAATGRVTYVAYNAGGTDVANGAFDIRGPPTKPRVGGHVVRFSQRATPARKRLLAAVVRALKK